MVAVVLAGGGTAGHTSPLIATAERLRDLAPDVAITCIGTAKGLETRVIPAAGLKLELVPPVPLPRKLTPDLLKVPIRLAKSVGEARRIIRAAGADVVVGFGGYVSMPAYLAARTLGIPVVIHEQNAVPGLANKVAARFAAVVGVTFPSTPLPKARFLGMPLRRGIAQLDRPALRDSARAELGLRREGPVLLVSGGSQGAKAINEATEGARASLLAAGVDILHVLGPKNFDPARHAVETDAATGARYVPVAYVDRMEVAYAAADLMVGRSGAGTVMETAAAALPCIFVPLPHGNGEQARNATFIIEADAGRLVPNAELTPERLLAEAGPLLADADARDAMSARLAGLVPADAAGALARLVLGCAGRDA